MKKFIPTASLLLASIGVLFLIQWKQAIRHPVTTNEINPQPLPDSDVKALLDAAREQNRLTEFGAELAMQGSRPAVTLLLQAIDLLEGEEQAEFARTLQALFSSEASVELQAFLIEHSNDENGAVAVQVQDALARVATGADVIRISQSIPSDPEQGLARVYLLATLERVRNPDAVPALAELCRSNDEALYVAGSIALGGIGTPEAVVELVQLIDERAVTDVDNLLVQALLSVTNRDAEATLREINLNTTNPVVKDATTRALENLRPKY